MWFAKWSANLAEIDQCCGECEAWLIARQRLLMATVLHLLWWSSVCGLIYVVSTLQYVEETHEQAANRRKMVEERHQQLLREQEQEQQQ